MRVLPLRCNVQQQHSFGVKLRACTGCGVADGITVADGDTVNIDILKKILLVFWTQKQNNSLDKTKLFLF